MPADLIAIASVGKAVGLGGFCAIESFGDVFKKLIAPCTVLLGRDQNSARQVTIEQIEEKPRGAMCRFSGFDDRTAVEQLRGFFVYIESTDLPELGDEAYYHFELQGMQVYADDPPQYVGLVKEVQNYPSMDAIDVLENNGHIIMIPLTREAVVRVDKAEKKITVRRSYVEELL